MPLLALAETVQITGLRTCFSALNRISLFARFDFTPQGLRVTSISHDKVALGQLYLLNGSSDGSATLGIERYLCDAPVSCYVNIKLLASVLERSNYKGTAVLALDDDAAPNALIVRLNYPGKGEFREYTLPMLTDDGNWPCLSDLELEGRAELDAQALANEVNRAANLSSEVEMAISHTDFLMSFPQESENVSAASVSFPHQLNGDIPVGAIGCFSLPWLKRACISDNFVGRVTMYFTPDEPLPLILQYDIASLGTLQIAIAPVITSQSCEAETA